MKVSSNLVVALDNGSDLVVQEGDFREIREGATVASAGTKASVKIVDGMSVVVGGVETEPDFGLEGIVMNMVENASGGGKSCLVMLNADSRMVTIPIGKLLLGSEGKAAISRKAALSSHQKVLPKVAELNDVLREYRKRSLSSKKMLSELQALYPQWDVSEKRIKKGLKELDLVVAHEEPEHVEEVVFESMSGEKVVKAKAMARRQEDKAVQTLAASAPAPTPGKSVSSGGAV